MSTVRCPEASVVVQAVTFEGRESILAKQTFDLSSGSPLPDSEPMPLVGMDIFEGEPDESPVRYESDFVPFKPQADLLCVGTAWAPRSEPTGEVIVTFGVGEFEKKIRVFGERIWQKKLLGLAHAPSSPEPFVSMPISYERAFGGRDGKYTFEANPLGRGYHRSLTGLVGKPLPNLEDPGQPIEHWRHRPTPRGFGPVGRAWLPRRSWVGTFDKAWKKHRAPELPEDFDERFFNGAPIDQQLGGYLCGDEEVRAINLHPEHQELRVRLPGQRLRCLLAEAGAAMFREEIPLSCDTLWLDMDALKLVLVWRARLPVTGEEPDIWIVSDACSSSRPIEHWQPELTKWRAEDGEAEEEVRLAEAELEALEG
ncbi:MAG: DUF2169 domain-containing protein [Planctomycetota bacterium]